MTNNPTHLSLSLSASELTLIIALDTRSTDPHPSTLTIGETPYPRHTRLYCADSDTAKDQRAHFP